MADLATELEAISERAAAHWRLAADVDNRLDDIYSAVILAAATPEDSARLITRLEEACCRFRRLEAVDR